MTVQAECTLVKTANDYADFFEKQQAKEGRQFAIGKGECVPTLLLLHGVIVVCHAHAQMKTSKTETLSPFEFIPVVYVTTNCHMGEVANLEIKMCV